MTGGMNSEAEAGNSLENTTRLLRGAAKNSVLSFAGAAISGLSGFGLSLILGRMLGPAGNGVVFQMISVFMIASAVAKVGLDTTCVWLLPRLALDRPVDVRRAVSLLLLGSLLGGCVAGAAMLVAAPYLGVDADVRELITAAAVFTPVAALGTVALAVTRGLGGIRPYVLIGSIGLPTFRLAATAVAMAFAASALLAGYVWLAALLIATALSLWATWRLLHPFPKLGAAGSRRRVLIREIGSYSLPRAASSILEQAIVWQDVLIVGLIAGPAPAGIYAVVSRLAQAGFIPSTSMRIVVAPDFSRLLHQNRVPELDLFYSRTAQWIALMSVPMYMMFIIFPEAVLRIFGHGFETGAIALIIVSVGALIWTSAGNVQSLLLMSGHSGWVALNKLFVMLLSFTMLLTLVPLWGITGAATAWAISMTLDVLLAVILVRMKIGVGVDARGTLTAISCAVVCTAIPAVMVRLTVGNTLIALISATIAGGVVYVITLYFLRRRFALDHAIAVFTRGRHGRTRSI